MNDASTIVQPETKRCYRCRETKSLDRFIACKKSQDGHRNKCLDCKRPKPATRICSQCMSWGNYGKGIGKWNIDHIKPLFRFDLTKESEQRKAFHFTNTRPLWHSENASNGAIARWRKEGN